MLLFSFIVFIFGSTVGSFLNSITYRLQTGEGFLLKRSYCPSCKTVLNWQDLIPLLSFFSLSGKCRYCQGKISWQYPLVELSTGILFAFVFYSVFQQSNILTPQQFLNFIYLLITICFLIIIFVSDLRYYIIPDKIIYPAILVVSIWQLVAWAFLKQYTNYQLLTTIYSALGAAAFFLSIVLISRGKWMGWGDPKLAFFMGLFLGFPNILVALFFAFFLGAIIGVGLIIFRKKTLKSEVPFGPFLVLGTLLALFWGESIINWYTTLILF